MPRSAPLLTCTIDRFEGAKAVLRFNLGNNDRQELIVSQNYLPKDTKEGEVLNIELLTSHQAKNRQTNLAKEILKEILNGK